jgi:hypothetical protein
MSDYPFDPGNYPRTYSAGATMRRTVRWVAVLLLAIVACGTALSSMGIVRNPNSPLFLTVVTLLLGGFAVYLVCAVDQRSVTLYADAIEVSGLFGSRRLACDAILGRRIAPARPRIGPVYQLAPKDETARDLKLPPFLQPDKFFHAWMHDIPRIP